MGDKFCMANRMGNKYLRSMKKFPKTIKEMQKQAGEDARSGEGKASFLDATNDVAFKKIFGD